MEKLKVVSIGGFGHIDAVFRDLADMQQADLVGMAPAYNGEDISKFLKLPPAIDKKVYYDDYRQMVKSLNPDVAIVSTRLDLIPTTVMKVIDLGCRHIIAEKPLALDMTTLEKLRETVERNKVNLIAMLTMRSEPHFIAAKQVYDSGAIGQAVLINARKSYKWGTRPDWFGQEDKYGGTIGWVGIHAFDFINYITGLTFKKLAAMKGNFSHNQRPACEDNCVIIVELSNGGHATISIDYCRPEIAPTHGDDWIRIVGTKGVLEASLAKKECSVISSERGIYNQPLQDGKDKMFRKFLLDILAGKNNEDLKQISFMLTKVCLLARDAAHQQKIVSVK